MNWAHIQIGPISLHAYGAMYALGALSVFWITWRQYRQKALKKIYTSAEGKNLLETLGVQVYVFLMEKKLEKEKEFLMDVVFWVMVFGVLGGRLFYTLVYNPSYYFLHPAEILAVWQGGMSIHGGLLGGILGLIYICRKRKISFWLIADLFAPAIFLGLMFGRFGNWINGELIGTPSALPWAVDSGDGVLRHPWPLYSAGVHFMSACLFLLLQVRYTFATGILASLFFIVLASNRFILEFWRMPDPQMGTLPLDLSMGQWLSLPLLIGGIGLFIIQKTARKMPSDRDTQ